MVAGDEGDLSQLGPFLVRVKQVYAPRHRCRVAGGKITEPGKEVRRRGRVFYYQQLDALRSIASASAAGSARRE